MRSGLNNIKNKTTNVKQIEVLQIFWENIKMRFSVIYSALKNYLNINVYLSYAVELTKIVNKQLNSNYSIRLIIKYNNKPNLSYKKHWVKY